MPRSDGANPDPREIELKFALDEAATAVLRADKTLGLPRRAIRLRSVYFDTPDHDLWNKGLTLRVRRTPKGFEQTLKEGLGAGVERGEWTAPVATDQPEPALLVHTPAAFVARNGKTELAPVCATSVERRTRLVNHDGGAAIEVTLDVGEVGAGERSAPIREMELELKAGDKQALFALGRSLMERAPLRPAFRSKAARGFALARGDDLAAIKSAPSRLDTGMSAGEAFVALGRDCLAQAGANAEQLQRIRRPETLHQLRVALRRFRAALAVFEPILAPRDLDWAAAETKWLAKELDGARDLDVFIKDAFRPAALEADRDPGFAAFGRSLNRAQGDAYDRAVAAAGSARTSRLLLDLLGWLETGEGCGGRAVEDADGVLRALGERRVKALAGDALDGLRRKVRRRASKFADLDAAGRHKLRIRIKRLRYAAEFFAPLWRGKRRTRFVRRLEDLQTALGELNDIAVSRDIAAAVSTGKGAGTAMAAGRTVGRREAMQPGLLEDAAGALRRFARTEPFWRG